MDEIDTVADKYWGAMSPEGRAAYQAVFELLYGNMSKVRDDTPKESLDGRQALENAVADAAYHAAWAVHAALQPLRANPRREVLAEVRTLEQNLTRPGHGAASLGQKACALRLLAQHFDVGQPQ